MSVAPLVSPHYTYRNDYRVFVRSGAQLESRHFDSPLLTLLYNCVDVSLASSEVVRRGRENGFRYETEIYRAAVVAGLSLSSNAQVLIVGSSGAVIARYLGERGNPVVVLEEVAREAACISERCRDLANVSVYVDSLHDGHVVEDFSGMFDAVICVDPVNRPEGGENLKGEGAVGRLLDPISALAEGAYRLLKPTGTLVFACGNLPITLAGHIIVSDAGSVRGTLTPPLATVEGLKQSGFRFVEPLIAYPHHAAPTLLIHPELAARRDSDWCLAALDTLEAPVSSIPAVLSSLKQLSRERDPLKNIDHVAPGVVILAHKHRVHSLLWGGSGAQRFFLTGTDGKGLRGGSQPRDVATTVLPFTDSDVATWFETIERSRLVSLVSPSVEEQKIRRELENALTRERELYVALAQEESKLKARFDATELRATTLERELYSTRDEFFATCEKMRESSKLLKSEADKALSLEVELRGVREQHRALFKEMRRFKAAAEESFVLVQKLQNQLDESKAFIEQASRNHSLLRVREKRSASELDSLRSRYRVLEQLSQQMVARATRLDAELRELKLSSLRIPGLARLRKLIGA